MLDVEAFRDYYGDLRLLGHGRWSAFWDAWTQARKDAEANHE